MPDMGASLLRVCGAMCLVIGVFFGAVWLFKNWRRLAHAKGPAAKLNVLEMKSLGHRQNIYVVGYERQRLLVAASPTGITLVSHLPESGEESLESPVKLSFSDAFQQVLTRGRS